MFYTLDDEDDLDVVTTIIFFTFILLMPFILTAFIFLAYCIGLRLVQDNDYDILPDYNEIVADEDYNLPTYDDNDRNLPTYDEAVSLTINNVVNYNSIN